MAFNGSGIYMLPSPEYPAIPNTEILSTDFNTIVEDISTALGNAFLRDGQASMQANLPMGGFKVTGAADGSAATDLVTLGQVQTIAAGIEPDGIPPGMIMAWCGGHFSNGANGAFTSVLGNSIAAANTYLNPRKYHVCDGSLLNDPDSPIFNGTGRYLPNLTDSRFLMGSTSAGVIGGSNTDTHTHNHPHTHTTAIPNQYTTETALTEAQLPSHSHSLGNLSAYNAGNSVLARSAYGDTGVYPGVLYTEAAGSGTGHNHIAYGGSFISGAASNAVTDAASSSENRPNFLSVLFVMKVK